MIRKTKLEDIPEVMNIIRDAQAGMKLLGIFQWQNGYPNETSFAKDIAEGISYVYVEDNEIVATAAMFCAPEPDYAKIYEGEWKTDGAYGVVHRIAVKKEAKRAARKIANEDARFILPNACETKIVVTMNARSLKNFFKHRCCNRAQWEIRALAWEMLKICKEVCPHLFAQAGPPCAFGACPEGKMSCGKAKEVRKFTEEFGVNK